MGEEKSGLNLHKSFFKVTWILKVVLILILLRSLEIFSEMLLKYGIETKRKWGKEGWEEKRDSPRHRDASQEGGGDCYNDFKKLKRDIAL